VQWRFTSFSQCLSFITTHGEAVWQYTSLFTKIVASKEKKYIHKNMQLTKTKAEIKRKKG